MMNVMKCFCLRKRVKTSGDLGIEIEVEGDDLPDHDSVSNFWRVDHDGSLQGEANEYVFKRPLKVEQVDEALAELQAAYEDSESFINSSVRAGIHVHVNVQELTAVQLYNYITLYSMFEGALLSYCGVGREGNLFCLPLNQSAALVEQLRNVAVTQDFLSLISDEYRYCAMNVKALGTYGSLEFRAMRSTSDLPRVSKWAKLLLHLRDVACMYDNPEEIIAEASIIGSMEMFKKCVGEHLPMFDKVMNLKRRLSKGVRSSQAIAFSCDWNIYNREVDEYEDFC
jgi:hypothetical protein